jgi:hypothetical protein
MEISSTSVFLLQRAPESLIRVSGQVLLGGFHLDGKRVNQGLADFNIPGCSLSSNFAESLTGGV